MTTTPASNDAVASLTLTDVWRRPLPGLDAYTRLLCRFVNTLSLPLLRGVENVDAVRPERDPFILALNHSQRPEAVLVPTRLIFERDRLLHFMADWNFMMVPFVATLYRQSQVIVVARKQARPRFLTPLRRLFDPGEDAFVRARRVLEQGRPVGIFVEGRMNRDPEQLLRGQRGAARLALETGMPLVPGGIRFPGHLPSRPIRDLSPMEVRLGEPIEIERRENPEPEAISDLHSHLMLSIAKLCGKSWDPAARRR